MIKRIKSITDMGVYKSYKWSEVPGISDFCERNIIYGWNYSGKTTLSRIFASLEKKEIKGYPKADFKLVLTDNTEISSENLDSVDISVRVFNAEYVRENLRWELEDPFSPISFDVGENVAYRAEHDENLSKILRINGNKTTKGRLDKYQPDAEALSEFEKQLQKEARTIKNETFQSVIEFDQRHLKAVIQQVVPSLHTHIIGGESELQEVRHTALTNNRKADVSPLEIDFSFAAIVDEVNQILSREPQQAKIDATLEANRSLYEWAKHGLSLHREINSCAFCNQPLTYERKNDLNTYFSNESARVREAIKYSASKIKGLTQKINAFHPNINKYELMDSFQTSFEECVARLPGLKEEYISSLESLEQALTAKENNFLFKALPPVAIDPQVVIRFNNWVIDLNNILKQHNNLVSNFVTVQNESRERLKRHITAEFLIREGYLEKLDRKTRAVRRIKRFLSIVETLERRNAILQGKLKSIVAGKDILNKFIKSFLNREDILIEVTSEDKFQLKRGANLATNLSEGEKTAISFAYFLVTLESLFKENKLLETVVFIDDPISSLDSNHIAQVYSLINSFFFRRISPEDPKMVVSCFKQLFISTHNFEFFSFLQDSSPMKKAKDNFVRCEHYFVQRVTKDTSTLRPLPKKLKQTKSEYVFLFELIHGFKETGCSVDDDRYLLIPNALRRFLEIYTLAKLPGTGTEIDQRLTTLMGGVHNLKVLHHFSHFTSLEKVVKHDELIMLIPQAIDELMQLLQKDSMHHNSLLESIGKISPQTS